MNLLDSIERRDHGTTDFPLAYYYVDEAHPRYEMPFHWHRELEISYILSGSYTFYLNDNVICAHEGDVVYIESGTIHGGKPNNCVYECIVFNPYPLLPSIESGRQYIQNLINHDTHIYPHFPSGTHPVCDATAKLMRSAKNHSFQNELEILTDLYYWFITVSETGSYIRNQTDPVPNADKIQAIKPILEYIENHYMENISLEQLAGLANLSVSHFCKYFKAVVHMAPIDYINYYRIECACRLLSSTQLSVTEIAYQIGYNDSGYFIRRFKRSKNMTPLQYRRRYK